MDALSALVVIPLASCAVLLAVAATVLWLVAPGLRDVAVLVEDLGWRGWLEVRRGAASALRELWRSRIYSRGARGVTVDEGRPRAAGGASTPCACSVAVEATARVPHPYWRYPCACIACQNARSIDL